MNAAMNLPFDTADLNEEQEAFRQAARDFAQKELAPHAAQWDEEGHFPREALVQAGNDGLVFLGVTVATLAAGPLVDGLGWERVNIVAVLPVVLVMAGVLRALRRPRPVLASSA